MIHFEKRISGNNSFLIAQAVWLKCAETVY